MIEINKIASNIKMANDGIWYSKKIRKISYPENCSEFCFPLEDHSFWFRHRNQCILETMRSFPPNGTILDVGGGNGFVSHAIQKSGMDVILVEPNIQGIRNAKSRGLQSIICSTLEDAGFAENSVPAIGIFDVLEHIENDVYFLNLIKNILVKDGCL